MSIRPKNAKVLKKRRSCIPSGGGPEVQAAPQRGAQWKYETTVGAGLPVIRVIRDLQTTGDGMVRFNPNLYSDGKVRRDSRSGSIIVTLGLPPLPRAHAPCGRF